jgi:hypothetical protein
MVCEFNKKFERELRNKSSISFFNKFFNNKKAGLSEFVVFGVVIIIIIIIFLILFLLLNFNQNEIEAESLELINDMEASRMLLIYFQSPLKLSSSDYTYTIADFLTKNNFDLIASSNYKPENYDLFKEKTRDFFNPLYESINKKWILTIEDKEQEVGLFSNRKVVSICSKDCNINPYLECSDYSYEYNNYNYCNYAAYGYEFITEEYLPSPGGKVYLVKLWIN